MSDNQQQWTSDDIPFVSLGEGVTKNGQERVRQVTGKYQYSVKRRIRNRVTTLHRIEGSKGDFFVFGSGAIDSRIALLPAGTPVRLTYKGEKDIGQDSPMKDISVEWPRGTVLLKKAVAAAVESEDSDSEDLAF